MKDAQTEHGARLEKTEQDLEQLRESSGDVAELKAKAATADEKAKEVEKLVCVPNCPGYHLLHY